MRVIFTPLRNLFIPFINDEEAFERIFFDEGAVKTAEPILTRDTPIDAVWRELDSLLEMKNLGQ